MTVRNYLVFQNTPKFFWKRECLKPTFTYLPSYRVRLTQMISLPWPQDGKRVMWCSLFKFIQDLHTYISYASPCKTPPGIYYYYGKLLRTHEFILFTLIATQLHCYLALALVHSEYDNIDNLCICL